MYPDEEKNRHYGPALRAASLYAAIGLLWIVLSDLVLQMQAGSEVRLTLQTVKGVGFVVVTAVALFALLRYQYSRLTSEIARTRSAEAELRESEARLQRAQQIANVGSWELDIPGSKLSWSDETYRIFELSRDEFKNDFDSFFACVHPDDQKEMLDAQQRALKGEEPLDIVHRIFTKSGIKHVHEVGQLQRDSDGNPLRLTGVVREVTDNVLQEFLLEESQRRLRHAITIANIGFWDWDVHSNTVYFSPEWKAQLGYGPTELPDKYEEWESRLHPEDKDRVLSVVQKHLEDPSAGFEVQFRLRHKDGSYRYVLAQGQLHLDQERPPGRMIGTHIDLTRQVMLEQQLVQAQKMESIGRLAGGVAHDFNNLLNVINGYTELIVSSLPENSPLLDDMAQIQQAGESAASLTRQLLAFSRKQIMEPKVLYPDDLVVKVSKMLARMIGEDITLELNLAANPARIRADPAQFEQVLMNMAVNARDALPNGGTVTIETEAVTVEQPRMDLQRELSPGSYVLTRVSDNGEGMARETQEQIFEPFFTHKRAGIGTGLGLSTALGIIQQSHGQILVSSEPGQGTVFEIYLPRIEQPVDKPRETAPEPSPRGSEHVLVVEDDDGVRRLVVRMLERAGFRVSSASDGDHALKMIEDDKNPVDLLLTDIVMARMSGTELAARVGRLAPEVRVLFMSGYADDMVSFAEDVIENPDILTKPFTGAQLIRKVREALDADQRR